MDSQRELLRGCTPTLVLAVLRDAPMHGYAIAREIEHRSGQSLQCREGTLYPVLKALEEEGQIAGEWREEGGRTRKVYVLTPQGAAALRSRAETWSEFVDAVQRVLGGAADDGAKNDPVAGPALRGLPAPG